MDTMARATSMLLLVMLAALPVKAQDDTGKRPSARGDLFHIDATDNSAMILWTFAGTVDRDVYFGKAVRGWAMQVRWSATLPVALPQPPDGVARYALVHLVPGKVIVFVMWDPRHFVIEEGTGKIIETGEGDKILQDYVEWVPLRLQVRKPQTATIDQRK